MLRLHRITLYHCIWGTDMLAIFHLKCASETAGTTALRFEIVLLNDEMSPELLYAFSTRLSIYWYSVALSLCSVH